MATETPIPTFVLLWLIPVRLPNVTITPAAFAAESLTFPVITHTTAHLWEELPTTVAKPSLPIKGV